jgi:hypothetical protein
LEGHYGRQRKYIDEQRNGTVESVRARRDTAIGRPILYSYSRFIGRTIDHRSVEVSLRPKQIPKDLTSFTEQRIRPDAPSGRYRFCLLSAQQQRYKLGGITQSFVTRNEFL